MRRIIAFFMVVGLFGLGLTYRAEAGGKSPEGGSLKIGYVDIGRVIGGYPKAKEIENTLRKEREAKQKEVNAKRVEIRKLEAQLKAQGPLLKEPEKKAKMKVIAEKQKKWGQLIREYDAEMRNELIKKQKEVLGAIDQAVRSFGKENGYTLILDARQVVYGLKGLDITAGIIKLLNKPQKPLKS